MSLLRRLRSIAIALAAVVVAAAAAAGILYWVFDMRLELAGSGLWPIVSFGDEEEHYETLELNRSQHYSRLLPAGPAPAAATAAPAADAPVAPGDTYWTDFRGPRRDGHYTQTSVRTDWSAQGLDPLWAQPIGGGYASFVVAQGRAFTIEQRRDQEVVAAYDAETGRELWINAWDAHFQEAMGGPGPRATPTWHAGRLYALGAGGELRALDAGTGDLLWRRNILEDAGAENLQWAMAAAPLIVDDLVVVQPGGANGWSVAAYRLGTGEVAWHALDDVQAYTSPMLATVAGRRQIVTVTAARAVGLDTVDGALLWEYPWTPPVVPNMAQPIVFDGNRVFFSSGYGYGAAVIEVARGGDNFDVREIWRNTRMKNNFSSAVLHEGYIYGMDEAILACLDAETGALQWKGGRYGHGQLLLAGDHLVILTERGDLALVRATPERHEEVGFSPAIEGKTWNVPALAEGRLLVRNARQMAAFDLRP